MRSILRVFLGSIAMLGSVVGADAAADANSVVKHAIEGFIRPAYADFHASTEALSQSLSALCSDPSQQALDRARQAFAETARRWGRVETIRFGPVTDGNLQDRILFWPDRKGLGLRQVQEALASKDLGAANPARLTNKSVAMQGLGALEFVLFGTGADGLAGRGEDYRCGYGEAVATNLEAMASTLDKEWAADDGFAAQWANPGPDNPLYRDETESLTELLEVFVNGLELIRDQRLGGFLADDPGKDKMKQALFWRSGLTADMLSANMSGLKALFDASEIAAMLPEPSRWVGQSIDFEFANANAGAEAAKGDIAMVLDDPKRREKLVYVRIVTSSLTDLIGTRLAGELGLTAGFSSLDGD